MFVSGKVANKQIFTIIRRGDNREKREERISVAEDLFELFLPFCELSGGN